MCYSNKRLKPTTSCVNYEGKLHRQHRHRANKEKACIASIAQKIDEAGVGGARRVGKRFPACYYSFLLIIEEKVVP